MRLLTNNKNYLKVAKWRFVILSGDAPNLEYHGESNVCCGTKIKKKKTEEDIIVNEMESGWKYD